jgi:hypothetical protein
MECMPKRPAILKRMFYELHLQHACHGHIDLDHLKLVSAELAKDDPEAVHADHLQSLLSVQHCILTDLLTVLSDHKESPRVAECLAVNAAMSAYLRAGPA